MEKLWIHGGAVVDYAENLSLGSVQWRESYIEQRAHKMAQFQKMLSYCEVSSCRMLALLRYFGDSEDLNRRCGHCDICAPRRNHSPAAPRSHPQRNRESDPNPGSVEENRSRLRRPPLHPGIPRFGPGPPRLRGPAGRHGPQRPGGHHGRLVYEGRQGDRIPPRAHFGSRLGRRRGSRPPPTGRNRSDPQSQARPQKRPPQLPREPRVACRHRSLCQDQQEDHSGRGSHSVGAPSPIRAGRTPGQQRTMPRPQIAAWLQSPLLCAKPDSRGHEARSAPSGR
ncbi:RecQ family zinc-binding domain-containing protein [uncultured Paludibaculum sp.]|uniref:RecQ family zinc-binding domain-containing protein n=1 Tax=uncultured Paludibaculum sp. TaxID=1765020 RepID=UPI00374DB00F